MRFAIGEKGGNCGKQRCSSSVPLLEWRFDLRREDTGRTVALR